MSSWYRYSDSDSKCVTQYRVRITLESPDGTVETTFTKLVVTSHGRDAAAAMAALQLVDAGTYHNHEVTDIQVVEA